MRFAGQTVKAVVLKHNQQSQLFSCLSVLVQFLLFYRCCCCCCWFACHVITPIGHWRYVFYCHYGCCDCFLLCDHCGCHFSLPEASQRKVEKKKIHQKSSQHIEQHLPYASSTEITSNFLPSLLCCCKILSCCRRAAIFIYGKKATLRLQLRPQFQ